MALPWVCKSSEKAQFKAHIILKECKGAQGEPQPIQNGQTDAVTHWMLAVFKGQTILNKLSTVSFDETCRYWLLKLCSLSNRTEKAGGTWFRDGSSERTGSMLREDSKFCSRAYDCTLLWQHGSCSWGWIRGFRWEINGEKPEIHFVRCCANVPNVTVSRLPASGRGACIFLSVPCRLPIWKILSKANLCHFTEATVQNENCHELQHCASDFSHKLIISFENTELLKQNLLEIISYTPEPGDILWRSSTRRNSFQISSFPHDLCHCN